MKQVKEIETSFKKENDEIKKELKEVREESQASKKELVLAKNELKELIGQVSLLKQELDNRKSNLQTDKHNLTNEPPVPSFHLSMNLMIAGLERFIEHNGQTIVGPYTDYVKWFDFVFNKLPINDQICCQYDQYLFMKIKFSKMPPRVKWLSRYGVRKKEVQVLLEAPDWTFKTHTMDDGWSHSNTKFALVFHPKDISKVVEMRKSGCTKLRDEWISEKGIQTDYYSADNELIICCKKKLDQYP